MLTLSTKGHYAGNSCVCVFDPQPQFFSEFMWLKQEQTPIPKHLQRKVEATRKQGGEALAFADY